MPSTITVDGAGDDAGDAAALAGIAAISGGVAVFSSTGQVAVDSAGDTAGDSAVFVPILPTVVIVFSPSNIGTALARQRERFVAVQGTAVTLPDGSIRPAMVHHSDHELLRSLRDDSDAPEKRPVVFVFGGSAWGAVTEGAKLTIGSGNMARSFIVGDPLHPKWRQGIITEVAVVAFPV